MADSISSVTYSCVMSVCELVRWVLSVSILPSWPSVLTLSCVLVVWRCVTRNVSVCVPVLLRKVCRVVRQSLRRMSVEVSLFVLSVI